MPLDIGDAQLDVSFVRIWHKFNDFGFQNRSVLEIDETDNEINEWGYVISTAETSELEFEYL